MRARAKERTRVHHDKRKMPANPLPRRMGCLPAPGENQSRARAERMNLVALIPNCPISHSLLCSNRAS
jgi:hypothetical protein